MKSQTCFRGCDFSSTRIKVWSISGGPCDGCGSRTIIFDNSTIIWYYIFMKTKHKRTLTQIFSRPVRANINFKDIEALFVALGGEVTEREGSRIAVVLFGQVRVFHRPHPSPDTDKGAVSSIRKWLEENGVKP